MPFRVKTVDNSLNATVVLHYNNGIPGANYIGGSWTNPWLVSKSTLVGENLPQFHLRKKRGELLPSTYFSKYSCEGAIKEYEHLYADSVSGKCYRNWVTGGLGWRAIPEMPNWSISEAEVMAHVPELDKSLVQEAMARIYESKFDILTFIAELADVREMILKTFRRLITRELPRKWKSVPSGWLETRYGWMPFVSDMIAIQKALSKIEKTRTRYTDRAGLTTETVTVKDLTKVDPTLSIRYITADRVSVGLRGSVTADMILPDFRANVVATAWEKVPLSFCLDWLVDVGRTISVFSALTRCTAYAASVGCKVKMTRESSYEDVSWLYPSCDNRSARGVAYCEAEYELRIPTLVPYLPQIRNKMNWLRSTDAGSLLAQRLKR